MPEYKYIPTKGSPLYSNLVSAPAGILFHEAHKEPMAHPAEILSEKLDEVAKIFSHLVAVFDSSENEAEREELTKSLILRMNEFYDWLPIIIKCFTAPMAGNDEKDVVKFLRQQNPNAFQKFSGATKAHHDLIRGMANTLKHKPSSLSFLEIKNHKGERVSGFYVRVVIGTNDQRGPDPDIHKIYRGKIHTGFSYNHFLLNVAGRVFNYMHWLDKALFEKKPSEYVRLDALHALLTAAVRLKTEFFPDEYLRPFAKIEQQLESYIVRFPHTYSKRPQERPDMIHAVNAPMSMNTRTSSSHAAMPYLQLIYPDRDLGLAAEQ